MVRITYEKDRKGKWEHLPGSCPKIGVMMDAAFCSLLITPGCFQIDTNTKQGQAGLSSTSLYPVSKRHLFLWDFSVLHPVGLFSCRNSGQILKEWMFLLFINSMYANWTWIKSFFFWPIYHDNILSTLTLNWNDSSKTNNRIRSEDKNSASRVMKASRVMNKNLTAILENN